MFHFSISMDPFFFLEMILAVHTSSLGASDQLKIHAFWRGLLHSALLARH
uniref:Uncharacterized protein n=1 Tax=Arundo donax TaxID=35708 RepID=A0A0A9FF14_ARUDO